MELRHTVSSLFFYPVFLWTEKFLFFWGVGIKNYLIFGLDL
jgi:hypothetical protein